MQNRLDKFEKILTKELNFYRNLLNYSREKHKSLISKEIDDISLITQKEEALVHKIRECETLRIEILKEISNEIKVEIDELNITRLSELTENSEIKKSLLEKKDELKSTLDELRKVNDLNTELIKQSLDIINQTVRMMSNTATNPNLYNKQKQDQSVRPQHSFLFDKKI